MMKKKNPLAFFNLLVLACMVMSLVMPGAMLAQAHSPDLPVVSQPAESASAQPAATNAPAGLTPPEQCGISLTADLGQDNELVLVNSSSKQVTNVNLNYSWKVSKSIFNDVNKVGIPVQAGTRAGGTSLGGSAGIIVWDATSGSDFPAGVPTFWKGQTLFQNWHPAFGLTGATLPLLAYPGTKTGSPVVVALSPLKWYIFRRDTSGGIRYMANTSIEMAASWQMMGGAYFATSDPAPVVTNPNHMLVFFQARKTEADPIQLFFQEMSNGRWRDEPVQLDLPSALSSITQVAGISAGDRNAAVFVAGPTVANPAVYALYARSWNIANNASDWSDTSWTRVDASIGNLPVVTTSRNGAHMGVAYLSSNLTDVIFKDKSATGTGWSSEHGPVYLNGQVKGMALISPFTNEEFLVANVTTSSGAKAVVSKRIKSSDGWISWISDGTLLAASEPGGFIQGSVYASHSAFAVMTDSARVPYVASYGNDARGVSTTTAINPSPNSFNEAAQKVARVAGKSYWVSLSLTSTYIWRVEIRNMSAIGAAAAWATSSTVDLTHAISSPLHGEKAFSMAVGDMDLDGSDEVVIATLSGNRNWVDLSWLRLTPGSNGALTITRSAVTSLTGLPGSSSVNVVMGDLDDTSNGTEPKPEGKRNEVFLSFIDSNTTMRVYYYQFKATSGVYALVAKNLESYGKAYKTLSNAGGLSVLRLAAGHVSNITGDSLVFLHGGSTSGMVEVYQLASSGNSSVRDLRQMGVTTGFYAGSNSRLVLAEIDGDSFKEVVYTAGVTDAKAVTTWYMVSAEANNLKATVPDETLKLTTAITAGYNNALEAGDLDQDGYEEAVYLPGNGNVILYTAERTLTGSYIYSGAQALNHPLVADLDGDSLTGSLAGCIQAGKLTVHSVSFAPPVYYENGVPKQNYYGEFGTEFANGEDSSKGFVFNTGQSFGFGGAYSQDVPVIGTNIFTFKDMITVGLAGSVGASTSKSQETTVASYSAFYGPSLGKVIYTSQEQKCYLYNLAAPGNPSATVPVTLCTGVSQPVKHDMPIEDWYDPNDALFDDYPGSWIDLPAVYKVNGIPRNDIRQYPERSKPPVDAFRVFFDGKGQADQEATGVTNPDSSLLGWSTASTTGGGKGRSGSLSLNLTYSTEMTIALWAFKTDLTFGFTGEWSHNTTWSDTLRYAGALYDYPKDNCTGCAAYWVTPYVYTATVRAPDSTYDIMVQDYYHIPTPGGLANQAEAAVETDAPAQDAPQAPILTSPSHPNPDTWYTSKDVTFDWTQPAGDSAPLKGYRLQLNQDENATPQVTPLVTGNQISYTDLSAGAYYLHLQAMGQDNSLSPWVTLKVQVDGDAPKAQIEFNPRYPNGATGWYNQPVTATLTATDEGSGVAALEYSTNGSTWQAYTTPLTFNTSTPPFTLSLRATDQAGNVSAPVSTPLQIDLGKPSARDTDGYYVSYANIAVTPTGNAQLKMGGALADALSGRGDYMIKAGDQGIWHSVDQVGVFAMPPDNLLTTTQPDLNWIYTPSFDGRGVYPLYGYGLDKAGNQSTERLIGTFWWEPDARPDFSESLVSASRSSAGPGDTVDFTIAARNSGRQESLVKVTDTLPAGLSVAPESIDEGGTILPDGKIAWELGTLWPGQTRYLHFSATVDPGAGPSLTNTLDIEGYWEWIDDPENFPPEPTHEYFITTNQIAVSAASHQKPTLIGASIQQGAAVSSPRITLDVNAAPGATHLYVKEWSWDAAGAQWQLNQESGWLPLAPSEDMDIQVYPDHTRALVDWTLAPGDGVRYIGLWVADGDGDSSNLNEGNLLSTNLVSDEMQSLSSGQRTQFRLPLEKDQLAVFNVIITSGDADLYVWSPRKGFYPNYYSEGITNAQGIQIQSVAFYAEESGIYTIELQSASDGVTHYQIALAAGAAAAGLSSQAQQALDLDASATAQEAAQALPAEVMTFSTPFSSAEVMALPAFPPTNIYWVFMPSLGR